MRREGRKILYRIVVGALLINLLWLMGYLLLGDRIIAAPHKVYSHLPELLSSGMAGHLWASLRRLLIGLPIALIIGILIAWLMYRWRGMGRIMSAFTYLAYPIPKLALLPIVMLIAGLGDSGKVTMIVLIILFQVIVNVRDSLANIPRESFLITTSLGASPWQLFYHVLIPATLPDILSTLRVAIGTSISVLFVTETYGTDKGMGYFIIDSWMRFDYLDMYGGIIVLSIAGFILFVLTDLLELWFCRWREPNIYHQHN
ncbi:MAG: ABC transporter permease subunit [Bacteroidales bacterium]|uniref:ABC transporter permease n=1 Tax=Porphyromonas sp. TaxID=1924944 RepID=UPI0029784494|nr:ABC transporter permease subunit [Porphyromonas sp.]MDD7438648.1 ABC transporter permease subunit [Bacteroidales bacterium]MDY3067904.1 ABC transporter permease subunit [Porphyromonas sp.]